MKPEQPAIYYVAGMTRKVLEQSPHTEALRQRGYPILFLTDAVDPFVIEALGKYRDKPFESVMDARLEVGPEPEQDAAPEPENAAELLARFKAILEQRVSGVQASKRLAESPVCLVVPHGGMAPHIERMLRARQTELPLTKRALEVNLAHPLVRKLAELHAQDPESVRVRDYVEVLYDQALLAEGSPIDNPASFARRLSQLLTDAASRPS
jgi:molecular chaperone HtpG